MYPCTYTLYSHMHKIKIKGDPVRNRNIFYTNKTVTTGTASREMASTQCTTFLEYSNNIVIIDKKLI